ncbi:tyrosine-type recombinase/integrase [Desulfococcus multivorans]|uniref:Integrase family protein n=1 Tax=Desulfococcus multivorans DSM 2059 TaxID=1121405 RepID=S7UJG4_DESML|nr:site-specific integrase [Desulfococcus multivorans]AOY60502.1 phage integrase protein (DNA breaking and rejoining enzyme) [Desulfococcus multivorans]AQV02601.1 integrase [Desulfococcus multivorans]EPR32453.1 integrase family protein [Desulfococcus multivorans DSM 2059]SKA24486.1 Site-specific recombinase XerD [Desulfococcus multivorans DSM 2059]
MGSVYKQKGSKNYWIKYYHNGRAVRESAQSDKKIVAKRLLARREADIAQGKVPNIHLDKVGFEQLAENFINDYRVNQRKSIGRAAQSVSHLRRYFGTFKAPQITTSKINEYILQRIEGGAANATINRELAALKRMLNLGAQQTPPLVDRVPHIPSLKENNTRKGFFEHSEFLALRDALPEYLKNMVTFAYNSGWRFNEITGLKWNNVDLDAGIVRLEAGETKNGEARTFYLGLELLEVFKSQWQIRKAREVITPYVFPNANGDGRIKDIRGSWFKGCNKAGIGKRLFHDFRRTAVRNMVRAGIPERVAMMVTGHKTRSVFDRYNIVSEADLKMVCQKQAAYQKSATGIVSGIVAPFPTKKGANRNG